MARHLPVRTSPRASSEKDCDALIGRAELALLRDLQLILLRAFFDRFLAARQRFGDRL